MKANLSLAEASPTALPAPDRIPNAGAPRPAALRPRKPVNLRLVLGAAAAVAAIAAGVHGWLGAQKVESTDDAFVEGRVIPIAAKVDGYVTDLRVDDNQAVTAGELLAVVDPRDYEAAVAEAKAAVAVATAHRSDAVARLAVVQTQIDEARADLAATVAKEAYSRLDAARYRALSAAAASAEDRDRTGSAETEAEARVQGAESRLAAAQANAREAQVAVAVAEAEVASAEARLTPPELNLGYTRVRAPRAGRIARRTVERGAYVRAGQTLLAIVPDEVWVTANFKETQLARIRPGAPVRIRIDMYPGHVFTGTVDSLQAGTGGRFSLLPPENATGNFVKVVQRIPVKIRLTGDQEGYVLAPGMSVTPEVSVR